MPRALLALFAAVLAAAPAAGQYGKAPKPGDTGPAAAEGVAYDQKLGAKAPLDLPLFDHTGRAVTLGEVAGGKPTILVLAYFRCPRLCNEVLADLLDALKEARRADPAFVAGGPFNLAVVSIDPKEGATTLARPRRQQFGAEYDGRGEDVPGIWFLSASHGQGTDVAGADRTVRRLADAVGFQYVLRHKGRDYRYDPDGGKWLTSDGRLLADRARDYDYQHAPGVVFLAPDGTVTRYLLGLKYGKGDVRRAVVEASAGTVGTLAEKVAFLCLAYDQTTGHYRPTMRAVAAVALPVMLAVVAVAVRTIRRGLAEKPLAPGDPVPAPAAGR